MNEKRGGRKRQSLSKEREGESDERDHTQLSPRRRKGWKGGKMLILPLRMTNPLQGKRGGTG